MIAGHLTAQPPRPSAINSHVSATFDAVIARGMAKEPDDRYGSAGALARAAQRALQTSGPVDPPNANTMARPYVPPSSVSATSGTGPTGPPTGPTAILDPHGADRPRQWLVPLMVVGVVAAVLLAAIGVVIGLLVPRNSGESTNTSSAATPTPGIPVPGPTVTVAGSPSSRPPPSTPAPPPVDPEVSSYQQLRQIADDDHTVLAAQAADLWVPQLSSKRPGVVDEGHVWDNVQTLQEHLRLRQQYGAKLLWSGDWSTFDASNYWVTIAPITFRDASGALLWCTSHGLDSDHCYAKLVSTTHGVAGSTAHN